MKKNLRIVSAAAALLAVAPIAASTVTVNAAAGTPSTVISGTDTTKISLGGSVNIPQTNGFVDITPNLTMEAANGNIPGSLTGSLSATVSGKTFTANLRGNGNVSVYVRQSDGTNGTQVTNWKSVSNKMYNVVISNVGFNFGSENAGKTITFASSNNNVTVQPTMNGSTQENPDLSPVYKSPTDRTVIGYKAKLDQNGTTYGLTVTAPVTAFNTSNINDPVFYNVATGAKVSDGTAMVLANYNGQLNIANLVSTVKSNFVAVQRTSTIGDNNQNGSENQNQFISSNDVNTRLPIVTTQAQIKDQLEKAGISVNANGDFTAPHSFKITVKTTSKVNGKSAELPVTFTVANVAAPKTEEKGVDKTIMHNAYYYDKDGQRVGKGKITRYETVSVVEKTVSINGQSYYKLANTTIDGKDVYVNADNISGTPRTLKHNAYVYASSKKRANKQVLKKGTEVTTYGAPYTFKNGKKYYKIGEDKAKTYVKASNF